jgi:hypothetical protein
MPLYEFKCEASEEDCKTKLFDINCSMKDRDLIYYCPECNTIGKRNFMSGGGLLREEGPNDKYYGAKYGENVGINPKTGNKMVMLPNREN